MSGVIEGMRRTLLSCTSIVRGGAVVLGTFLGTSALFGIAPACARDGFLNGASSLVAGFDFDRQEIAALSVAAAMLGFSVVAAILLMRACARHASSPACCRTIRRCQLEADRFRALLFAEPQVLISWAAGEDRPDISGDVSLIMPHGSDQYSPQRVLAFGSWLLPEQALAMDHAVDKLREAGEGFCSISPRRRDVPSKRSAAPSEGRRSSGFASSPESGWSSPNSTSSTIGCWRKPVRFAPSQPPFRCGVGTAQQRQRSVSPMRPTRSPSMQGRWPMPSSAISNCSIMTIAATMAHALADGNVFQARVPIVTGGQRRIFDIHALNVPGGSAGIAVGCDRSGESTRRAGGGWPKHTAACSISSRPASRYSMPRGG